MKWTLDVERKDIDLGIQDNRFVLKTNGRELQFVVDQDIACKMLMQIRAVMQKPWMPDEEMVEFIEGKALNMGFVLNSDDHWVMDLRYGSAGFHAALTRKELERFSEVLGGYLSKVADN
ncbi:hypothetical protein [Methanomethylovorans sp.]|uniref:hypothetical protein n=1 Tax=Methanomethylovorans sp. TaxID=2758717 RepID=UPI00351C357E